MWFHADRDPKVFLKSIWTIARWLLFGPLVGWGGPVNGLFIGLAFRAGGCDDCRK